MQVTGQMLQSDQNELFWCDFKGVLHVSWVELAGAVNQLLHAKSRQLKLLYNTLHTKITLVFTQAALGCCILIRQKLTVQASSSHCLLTAWWAFWCMTTLMHIERCCAVHISTQAMVGYYEPTHRIMHTSAYLCWRLLSGSFGT